MDVGLPRQMKREAHGFLLLLVFLIVATWKRYRTRREIRILMGISFLAFAGEGALGASDQCFD
jgi:cytochrome c oxidase assembly protein subunit 15